MGSPGACILTMSTDMDTSFCDEDLFKRFSESRDEKAFAELVQRYQHFAYRVAMARCRSNEQAEDAVQEAFLRLARNPDQTALQGFPCFKAWFFGLVSNVARSRDRAELRHRSREQFAKERSMRLPASDGVELTEAPNEELQGAIENAILALDEPLQLTLIMHYLENISQHEIGRLLQVSQPVVARRIRKGLELMRIHLVQAGFGATVAALPTLLKAPQLLKAPPALQGVLSQPGFFESASAQGSIRMAPVRHAGMRLGALKAIVVASVTLGGAGAWYLWHDAGQRNAPTAPFANTTETSSQHEKAVYQWSLGNGPDPTLIPHTGTWQWTARTGTKPSGMLTDTRDMTAVELPVKSTKGKCWKITATGYPISGFNLFMRGEHRMPTEDPAYVMWGKRTSLNIVPTRTESYLQDNIEVVATFQGSRSHPASIDVIKKNAISDGLYLTAKGFIVYWIQAREIDPQEIPEEFRDYKKLIEAQHLPMYGTEQPDPQ